MTIFSKEKIGNRRIVRIFGKKILSYTHDLYDCVGGGITILA